MTTPSSRRDVAESRRRARAGDRLGQREVGVVLRLAEILAAEELLQADDLGALRGRLRMPATARARLSAASAEQRICTRPTCTFREGGVVVMR